MRKLKMTKITDININDVADSIVNRIREVFADLEQAYHDAEYELFLKYIDFIKEACILGTNNINKLKEIDNGKRKRS